MKNVIAAINATLALRASTSLNAFEADVQEAAGRDYANFQDSGTRTYEASRIFNAMHWAFRDAVKDIMAQAFLAKTAGAKEGVMAKLPQLVALKNAMDESRLRLTASGIIYAPENPILPLWEDFALVGNEKDGSPIFEKQEFWTQVEFANHMRTKKFAKQLGAWSVSKQLSEVVAPALVIQDNELCAMFEERLNRSLQAKHDRTAADKRWDYNAFYKGGIIGQLTDDIHIMSVLALIGRTVQQLNNITNQYNLSTGRAMMEKGRTGMEQSTKRVTMGVEHLEFNLEVETNNVSGDVFMSGDNEKFINQHEALTESVQDYIAEWQAILPAAALKMLDLKIHGGYQVVETEKVEPTFNILPLEYITVAPEKDVDVLKADRERRLAYAMKMANAKRAAFVPRAITL